MLLTVRNNADFKGMLLQVRSKPGQKYIFLLFRTKNGLRMCLSKNTRLVESMFIGKKYRVKGQEYTHGNKTYLNMASATQEWARTNLLRRRRGLVSAVASLLVIIGVGSTGVVLRHNSEHSNQTDAPSVTIQSHQDEKTPTDSTKISNIIGQSPSTTSADAQATTPSPTPTPNSSAVKRVATPTAPPVVPPTPPPNTTQTVSPPTAPADVQTNGITETEIGLSWTASTGNGGSISYRVYRDGVEVGPGSGTSFHDSGLTPDTNYTYSVRAYDDAGNQSDMSSGASAKTLQHDDSTNVAP